MRTLKYAKVKVCQKEKEYEEGQKGGVGRICEDIWSECFKQF